MSAKKKTAKAKSTAAKKTATKRGTAKAAPARKKAAAKPKSAKRAPAKKAAPAAKPAAAPPKPAVKPVVAPAAKPVAPAPKPGSPPAPAGEGRFGAHDVNRGHIFSLRPRVNTGFSPEAFDDARRELADERYATIEDAARSVAERALELSNTRRTRAPFPS
jgi:hypothetical protein